MTSLPCSRPTHILTKLKQLANACGSPPSTTCNGLTNGGKLPGRSSFLEYDLKMQDRNCTVCGGKTLSLARREEEGLQPAVANEGAIYC